MPFRTTRAVLPAIAGLLLAMTGGFVHADEVTIYRCTDARGQVALRDTPCGEGQHQRTINMVRPRDPPPRPASAIAPPEPKPAAAAQPATVVIVRTTPQPVYECVTPDGEHYTSDTPAGNPRWVPLWTLGYPVGPGGGAGHGHGGHHGGHPDIPPVRPATGSGQTGSGQMFGNVGRPSPRPPGNPGTSVRPPVGVGVLPILGSWISDRCERLPQEQVCSRLSERRWELDSRYNSAMQSERKRIDAEQRDIDARLASDCGNY